MYNKYNDENDNYDEFGVLPQYEDMNSEDNFRANDDFEMEDDFVNFTPYYYCPFFRQQHFPGTPPPRPPFGPPGGHEEEHGMPPAPHEGMPMTPPPSFKPPKPQEPYMHGGIRPRPIDPDRLRRCRFRFVYIWLRNGNSFWAYLTYVGRTFASGYRWNGRRWVDFRIDIRRIEDFHCH